MNVVAVVSRYCRESNLVPEADAYAGTVTAAIDTATLRRGRSSRRCSPFAVDHAEAGWVEPELRGRRFAVDGVEYGQKAVIKCSVPTRRI